MQYSRRDLNHAEIRDALRCVCGAESVRDTADLGGGFPDLVVGWKGRTYMFEVKSSPKAKFRADQVTGMRAWRGDAWIRVESVIEAFAALGIAA